MNDVKKMGNPAYLDEELVSARGKRIQSIEKGKTKAMIFIDDPDFGGTIIFQVCKDKDGEPFLDWIIH